MYKISDGLQQNFRKVLKVDSNNKANKLLDPSKGKNDLFWDQQEFCKIFTFVTFTYLNYIPSSCKISEKSLE